MSASAQRRRIQPKDQRVTAADRLRSALLAQVAAASEIRWPSPRFRDDPVAFARQILGVEPWSKQIEILEAVRDHSAVAITSGHKTGKSASASILALWFYCSFPDARVVMSSTTSRQVDAILWRELRMMRSRGGRCADCRKKDPNGKKIPRPCPHSALIDGELGALARTGLRSDDFREIKGFTAREPEAVAGVSGENLMYLVDEASGVPDTIFEAIEGNRMGGARLVMFSNPTRNEGAFFDAFHSKSDFYRTIRISSEETPNYVEGRKVIPGLATRSVIDEKREEWGEESALYKVRILGEFALAEDGRIFSVHTIAEAEARWHDTPAEGRLYIGVDAAGESGSGDEAVLVARRGAKVLVIEPHQGITPAAHLVHILAMVERLKQPREVPVVVIDAEGAVGNRVMGELLRYLDGEKVKPFELSAIRASNQASRQPQVYDRMRDLLAANLEGWLRGDGGRLPGAIPEDEKLAAEMHLFEWEEQARTGKLKLIPPKKQIRRQPPHGLGRSPDRFDALTLACWEPLGLRAPERRRRERGDDDDFAESTLDPYAGGDAWG